MGYCTNCGTKIENTTKFCPNCGTIIGDNLQNKDGGVPSPPKRSMQKNVIKSLKNKTSDYAKTKTKETYQPNLSEKKQTINKVVKTQTRVEKSNPASDKKPANKWIIFYFIFSFVLLYLFGRQDEVMGLTFFSLLILIGYWIRRKKEKPFHIVLKIILILQGILAFSTLMRNLQYLENGYSLLAVLLLAPFTFIIIVLFIKGNKN